MSHYDLEALLDDTANADSQKRKDVSNGDDHPNGDRGDRNREKTPRDSSRDRRRRERRSHSPRSESERTPRSETGSHRSRRRSRSREHSGRHSRRHRGGDGDYYRGARGRSRSRSPNRHYRPRDSRRDRDDDRSYRRGKEDDRRQSGPAPRSRDPTPPQLTEDERDRRTVFVQQLAARLRTKELKEFFEKAGPVAEAQIVKDRVSNRSKGVGYVEFKNEDSVTQALQLTGHKLLGIPVIVQLTEAEKNRQVRNSESSSGHPNSIPFHRLYVGNIHFSITETDLQNVFEPFGELEFVQLQKDDTGRSRGYGFVQFRDATQAREALEKMNGFDLAGRPIRVGLGNDKFTPESTANLLQRFQGQNQQQYQGSAFSGAGGRGPPTSNFDRAGGRENEKGSGASALDDTDVAGVNFNNYSRDALMRKLARTDEASSGQTERQVYKPKTETKPLPVNVNMASRCVVLHNMFDSTEEEGDEWIKELEDDVRSEAEEKYGHVVHIALDPNSPGDIYLKFDKVQGGENAIKGLNGRYFGGKMITAAPVVATDDDSGGIHINSGIISRAFYLLSKGGIGINSTFATLPGIGLDKAAAIFYRAMTVYFTTGIQITDAKSACLYAVTDLYGSNTPEYRAVVDAWGYVGVNDVTVSTELISNGQFESSDSPWVTNAVDSKTNCIMLHNSASEAHGGKGYALLGASSNTSNSQCNIAQSVTMPNTTSSATITYWIRIKTQDNSTIIRDSLEINAGSTSGGITTSYFSQGYSNCNYAQYATWTQQTFSLTSAAVTSAKGKTFSFLLKFSTVDSVMATFFYVDDISFKVTQFQK